MKMARLFRSKSCTTACHTTAANSLPFHSASPSDRYYDVDDDQDGEEEEEEEGAMHGYFGSNASSPVTTPFIAPEERRQRGHNNHQFPVLAVLMAALRKSLVTCSVDRDDVANMDIGWPTDVRHVSHVTFDPFNGFLGVPVELQPHVPRKVPSASASVFGVSAQSMQCSYDDRGNSVPTILLMMQHRLYSEGGLRAEGIFRINAENSQEENVRNQLNKGLVPCGIDVHCLAGLIKTWFRELPGGVLDSLTPEQVMRCNTEEECTQLINLLPTTEAELLDWAINLMADVVQHEHYNKMNARNIAMVFAPNMTQMADPLTALIHAVQVMNFLKTLIMKTIREREESAAVVRLLSSPAPSANHKDFCPSDLGVVVPCQQALKSSPCSGTINLFRSATLDRLESDSGRSSGALGVTVMPGRKLNPLQIGPHLFFTRDKLWKVAFEKDSIMRRSRRGILDKLSLRKGMQKLCRHPVSQLSKPVKKNDSVRIVNTRGGREAWT